jgi:hypothetical protein
MEELNKFKLFAYNLFMLFNPLFIVVAFIISFFSDNYALKMLGFCRWVFVITLFLAIPQLYDNYKKNSNVKK